MPSYAPSAVKAQKPINNEHEKSLANENLINVNENPTKITRKTDDDNEKQIKKSEEKYKYEKLFAPTIYGNIPIVRHSSSRVQTQMNSPSKALKKKNTVNIEQAKAILNGQNPFPSAKLKMIRIDNPNAMAPTNLKAALATALGTSPRMIGGVYRHPNGTH